MRLLVTGATGFLGQQVVLQALARGHRVVAVVRPGRDLAGLAWADREGVEVAQVDLAAASAADALAGIYSGCAVEDAAVIHAAGSLHGDDATQHRETVEPTRRLLDAMRRTGCRRLVLVSSLSVYGYAALPSGAQLDETTPLEPDPAQRDAYCRAKLAQEALALDAAQLHGLAVTALRPGMIYGPGRWWGARLGIAKGPLGIVLGGAAALPLCHVDHCAAAAVLAAERQVYAGDVHVERDASGHCGAFEAINAIDDAQPGQRAYLAMLRRHVAGMPSLVVRLPWGLLRRLAGLASLVALAVPPLRSRLPGLLRPASLHARCKPLRFSNCRLHDRLGWRATVAWEEAIAAVGKGGADGRR
jgi:nucleoside-diphosphate-sugar epimerase